MNKQVKLLAEDAGRLSTDDQVTLVELLMDRLAQSGETVDSVWQAEIRSRVVAYRKDTGALHDADHVLHEARGRLRAL
jgi:putative addiction module component (TIGR02574 family)